MGRVRKAWYDAAGVEAVRVVPRSGPLRGGSRRGRRERSPVGLGECLRYPLSDGPGVALLVVLPPFLWFLSLPVFDLIAVLEPLTRKEWALGLLVLPVLVPLLFSLTMTLGYVLLFLGHVLVASAVGETEQPRWPEWEPNAIAEGLGRWLWAFVFGLALGGFPVVVYWTSCGDVDWFDRVVFADLLVLGVGYAQMALAAALLHDSLLAANPFTVLGSIVRVGWDYLLPCLTAGVAVGLAGGAFWAVVFRMPSPLIAAVALWAFWVFALYEALVVVRMLGLTYYVHSADLQWFHDRPKWGTPARFGRIYTNS